MRAHLEKYVEVEAAHWNPAGDARQQRLHGHSYRIEVLAAGAPDRGIGWIVDFAELKALFEPLRDRLDHACLNEVPGLEDDATLPALHRWIEARLVPRPAWLSGVRVRILGDCAFRPETLAPDPFRGIPSRVRFTFEAAQSLPNLPAGHHCQRVHGHSYRIEVGAKDLGALGPDLAELYEVLDHRYLNEIPGLEEATCERICAWVWDRLSARGRQLTVVGIQETGTARCLYFGE